MGKHLTKDEYINKLSIANPNVEDVLNITGTSHIPDCCSGKRKTVGGYQFKYLYDQTRKDGTVIPGAITLGLITEEEALRQLNIPT